MATVGITIQGVDTRTGGGVPTTVVADSETITSSGVSQDSANTAPVGSYFFITASGGAVWVAFGTAPTAAAGTAHLVPDGTTRVFYNARTDAAKAAIIDA